MRENSIAVERSWGTELLYMYIHIESYLVCYALNLGLFVPRSSLSWSIMLYMCGYGQWSCLTFFWGSLIISQKWYEHIFGLINYLSKNGIGVTQPKRPTLYTLHAEGKCIRGK